MNKIKRIHEFLDSYKTLDPELKRLVGGIRQDFIKQLFDLYAKNGIDHYQMKPNQQEIDTVQRVLGLPKYYITI